MSRQIDHIGIAVSSIAEARRFYEALGLEVEAIEEVPHEGVRVAMIPCGSLRIELLEPLSPDSAVGRFLDRRGPGLHHVCLASDDVRSDSARLREAGLQVLREEPTPGAGGTLVQFVHPKSASGVLFELAQGGARHPDPSLRSGRVGAGDLVVVHCVNPPEKLWGWLGELAIAGVCLRGISLSSFDDWVREVVSEETPSLGLVTLFVPMARVEKLYLDEPVGAVESYRQRFERRAGCRLDEIVPR